MRRWGIVALVLALVGLVPDASAAPPPPPPVRPGPAVLWAPPPPAPQLENRDPRFRAEPILVMGHEAYVDGEYLYQDWIYDDNGADTGDSDAGGSDTAGDAEYPDDRERYGGNAADLVELRIAQSGNEVAYRFTLNTMLVADAAEIELRVGDDVLTTWGTGAEVDGTAVPVHTDLEANQITVTVPRSVADPRGVVPVAIGVGLHEATGVSPFGVPSPYMDSAFSDERPEGLTPHDAEQAAMLAAAELPARAVDFTALARRRNSTTVPSHGTMSRIFPSRISFGEGKDYDATPELLGQLQPYSIYVPTTYDGVSPVGLALDLHSLGEHHWQYNGSTGVQQIGEERGDIVITCECRGEDGWYQQEAEYDVFEMWNDVRRHFAIDDDRTVITGYSMGGYATYRLASLYPDLFSSALSIVGPPADGIWLPPLPPSGGVETNSNVWLENVRNVPFLNAVAVEDELVPYAGVRAHNTGPSVGGSKSFQALGYRYRFVSYPAAEHLTIGALSYDLPYQAEFFGDGLVDRDPDAVVFTYVPDTDHAALGLVHDKAYWVSGIRLADATAGDPLPAATVRARSSAFGRGAPVTREIAGGGNGPLPYVEEGIAWEDPAAIPAENRLNLRLTNVGEVTIDGRRARLDGDRPLTIWSASTHDSVVHLVLEDRVVDVRVPAREGHVQVVG